MGSSSIAAFGRIFHGKTDLDHGASEYLKIEDTVIIEKQYGNAIYEPAK